MTKTKPLVDRVRDSESRKREKGLKKSWVWVYPEDRDALRKYAESLRAARESNSSDSPYIIKVESKEERAYNPNYGDLRICKCGHPYERHFDSYENMNACGCKYCSCWTFEEALDNE